jgi:primosomal protein N' (replication factor Y) (superfamily II helicase)
MPVSKQCPGCQQENTLVACGPGVERVVEEVKELFPEARILEMTSDTMENPKVALSTVRAILERQADIIVGTQMVAKGHHFPFLTLVGVVDADLGLEGGDLRASEKSYQLLHQVAGRAGREGLKGRALLQTYQPHNPLMEALKRHDRDAFVDREKEMRKMAAMPPYGRLAALILSGKAESEVRKMAQEMAAAAPDAAGLKVLGPAPAALSLLRGQYRYRLLVKAPKGFAMQKYLSAWISRIKLPSSLKLKVDIDPYSFL